MSFSEDHAVRKQLESSSNMYGIVRSIQEDSRTLADDYDNKILHSEAITCVVRGAEPDPKHIYDDEYEAETIREMFCYIEDQEVCNAVYDSFFASKEANNLKYIYNDIQSEPIKARIRILTRMLWDQLM